MSLTNLSAAPPVLHHYERECLPAFQPPTHRRSGTAEMREEVDIGGCLWQRLKGSDAEATDGGCWGIDRAEVAQAAFPVPKA